MQIVPIILAAFWLLALSACASPPSPPLDPSRAECWIDPAPLSCAAEMDAEARTPPAR